MHDRKIFRWNTVNGEMESDSEPDTSSREDFSSQLEFKKLQRNLMTSGFREGAAAGKEASFQTGFDKGYAEGFRSAFALGKFNGVVDTLKRNAECLSLNPEDLEDASFENTRHGMCPVCKRSANQLGCGANKTEDLSITSNVHKELIERKLDEQKFKFLQVLEQTGVIPILSSEQ